MGPRISKTFHSLFRDPSPNDAPKHGCDRSVEALASEGPWTALNSVGPEHGILEDPDKVSRLSTKHNATLPGPSLPISLFVCCKRKVFGCAAGRTKHEVCHSELHRQILKELIIFRIVSDLSVGDKSWKCRKLSREQSLTGEMPASSQETAATFESPSKKTKIGDPVTPATNGNASDIGMMSGEENDNDEPEEAEDEEGSA